MLGTQVVRSGPASAQPVLSRVARQSASCSGVQQSSARQGTGVGSVTLMSWRQERSAGGSGTQPGAPAWWLWRDAERLAARGSVVRCGRRPWQGKQHALTVRAVCGEQKRGRRGGVRSSAWICVCAQWSEVSGCRWASQVRPSHLACSARSLNLPHLGASNCSQAPARLMAWRRARTTRPLRSSRPACGQRHGEKSVGSAPALNARPYTSRRAAKRAPE